MRDIFDARYYSVMRDILSGYKKRNLYHIAIEHSETISHLFTNISHERSEYIAKENIDMDNRTIKELSIELTVEITSICDNIKGRSVFVNQILRSCSSIGANSYEAKYAQSKADFINKMEIALKNAMKPNIGLKYFLK